jgi:DNA-binding transcriptional LysR family regulator
MDVRSLRYFVAVADCGSFSRGAEAMNVVQSAVSHRVRDLEDEVGTPLFNREGRAVRLTDAGVVLLGDARNILHSIEAAKDRVRQLRDGEVGRIRIGFQGATCRRQIVSESLIEFRTRYPKVELELSPMTGLSMEDALQNGEIDGGFFYRHGNPPLDYRQLYLDDWLLAVPSSHPLASMTELHLKDLQGEKFIVLPRRVTPILHDRIMAACLSGGLTPEIVQEAFEEPMVLNLVAVGLGVAFVLDSLPTELNGSVVLKRVIDFRVPTELCFLWKSDGMTPTLSRFLDVLDQVRSDGCEASKIDAVA